MSRTLAKAREKRNTNKFFTDADIEYIKKHTERVFSDKQHRDNKIKQMEKDNEKCLQKNLK
tara:strand:+ start:2175 stop:2357 length:183 start_codon:yes stop_codon:yes gene_type:complete